MKLYKPQSLHYSDNLLLSQAIAQVEAPAKVAQLPDYTTIPNKQEVSNTRHCSHAMLGACTLHSRSPELQLDCRGYILIMHSYLVNIDEWHLLVRLAMVIMQAWSHVVEMHAPGISVLEMQYTKRLHAPLLTIKMKLMIKQCAAISCTQYEALYQRSINEPAKFWAEVAETFHWHKKVGRGHGHGHGHAQCNGDDCACQDAVHWLHLTSCKQCRVACGAQMSCTALLA